jgi:hypothetical protein
MSYGYGIIVTLEEAINIRAKVLKVSPEELIYSIIRECNINVIDVGKSYISLCEDYRLYTKLAPISLECDLLWTGPNISCKKVLFMGKGISISNFISVEALDSVFNKANIHETLEKYGYDSQRCKVYLNTRSISLHPEDCKFTNTKLSLYK